MAQWSQFVAVQSLFVTVQSLFLKNENVVLVPSLKPAAVQKLDPRSYLYLGHTRFDACVAD